MTAENKVEETTESKPEKVKTPKEIITDLAVLLMDKRQPMLSEYRARMNYTGGMLSTSMGIAYAKGIDDVIKLILKQNEGEKNG